MIHHKVDDEFETPDKLYQELCEKYNFHPYLDVAADLNNSKVDHFLDNSLNTNWSPMNWCNPPHSKTKEFVLKAEEEYKKGNRTMMLVPANSICAHYFDDIFDNDHATYHRISGRPQFLKNGKVSDFPSRNSYFVVIWRKI